MSVKKGNYGGNKNTKPINSIHQMKIPSHGLLAWTNLAQLSLHIASQGPEYESKEMTSMNWTNIYTKSNVHKHTGDVLLKNQTHTGDILLETKHTQQTTKKAAKQIKRPWKRCMK